MSKQRRVPGKGLNRKLLYGSILITTVLMGASVIYYTFFLSYENNWTAAIIDQLTVVPSLFNQDFKSNCTSILTEAGYEVKYHSGEDIDVKFFEDLPSKGGHIMILRAHSAVRDNTDYVDLFTSEPFREGSYVDLALDRQISKAQMYSFDEWYFAVGPTFVSSTMNGRFRDNLIILMGCDSMHKTSMAEALISKGARVVIGWTGLVDVGYTDHFTLQLLKLLLIDRETVKAAVDKANQQLELQSNPYGAELAFYTQSEEAQSYVVPIRRTEVSEYLMGQLALLQSRAFSRWKQGCTRELHG
jgi:hypothetical protein